MCSYYLTDEAAEKRINKLVERLASEAVSLGEGGRTWPPESDAWKVPDKVRRAALERAEGEGH